MAQSSGGRRCMWERRRLFIPHDQITVEQVHLQMRRTGPRPHVSLVQYRMIGKYDTVL